MCGRTGLNLHRENIRCACAYLPPGGHKYEKPQWSDEHNDGKTFTPSNNIAPTEITPILVCSQNDEINSARILKPMMWGMIPPWHKGDYNKHGLSTNNCRVEGIFTSKLYGAALREGKRCVVLAEGFYEWQTTDKTSKTKQPYFIYVPQSENVQIDDPTTWHNEYDETTGWKGVKLLRMAGLYNVWNGPNGPIYSYSVITLESNETLNWLHHRMPAILDDDAIVQKWLDTKNISAKDAVNLIKPAKSLSWHPVSTLVNNSRNKSQDSNKRISLENKQTSQNVMTSWLSNKTNVGDAKKKSPRNDILKNWLAGKPTKRKCEEYDVETKKPKKEPE